jgi:hypothetical protein
VFLQQSAGKYEDVAESFRNSGDLSVGYQHVVWTFKPAMAVWNAALKKRDAKNACFLLAGQNLTEHEFAIQEKDSEIYVACAREAEKVEWLIALDFVALLNRNKNKANGSTQQVLFDFPKKNFFLFVCLFFFLIEIVFAVGFVRREFGSSKRAFRTGDFEFFTKIQLSN